MYIQSNCTNRLLLNSPTIFPQKYGIKETAIEKNARTMNSVVLAVWITKLDQRIKSKHLETVLQKDWSTKFNLPKSSAEQKYTIKTNHQSLEEDFKS